MNVIISVDMNTDITDGIKGNLNTIFNSKPTNTPATAEYIHALIYLLFMCFDSVYETIQHNAPTA